MQNRGLIKFFAIIFALVSIYQLTFTFVANKVKNDAKSFAGGKTEKEIKYLDSIGSKEVFLNYFTYDDVKKKQINKGLDLEGGINVILQISVKDVLKQLANNTTNPVFNKALDNAKKNQQGNQSFLDAFYKAFDEAAAGTTTKLSSPDVFGNKNLADKINFKTSDADVKTLIGTKVDETVESAFRVLRERIDKFGVTQPNIVKLGNTGRILVELPGVKDIDRATDLVSKTAELQFWETYKSSNQLIKYFDDVNNLLKKTEKKETPVVANQAIDTVKDKKKEELNKLLVNDKKEAAKPKKGENPLFEKLSPNQPGSTIVGFAEQSDVEALNAYLRRDDVRALLPSEFSDVKFFFGKPIKNDQLKDDKTKVKDNEKEKVFVELYAIKGNISNVPPLSGSAIIDAKEAFDQMGKPAVSMQMNPSGSRIWEELTGKAFKEQGNIAIVLDSTVYSAPGVTRGAISGGNSEISGTFSVEEAKDLANVLRAGKLPATAEIVQREIVGPSLGQEAIDNGTTSAIVGLLLVSLWMLVYYGKAGWYANIALAINILFLFGVMASFGFVLTLPGIAGIVLTLGTAVDANIIIYERAKEELRAGKLLDEAINKSFSWTGAMRSIIDANVTHVLTGAILYVFGTGPVKGFALTLLIGIGTSLFTSIFITRILLDRVVSKNITLDFTNTWSKDWFTGFNFDFLKIKRGTYIFSSAVIIISCISIFGINGLDQGVDFVGGRTFQVKFEKPVNAETISNELASKDVFQNAEAKIFGSDDQLKITTKYKIAEEGAAVDKEVNQKLYNALKKYYSAGMTYDKFITLTEGKTIGLLQGTKVSPSISKDIKTNSFWAVIGAMIVVGLYLVVSFHKIGYSLGALAAVVHDVIFVLGIYSLCYKFMPFHMEMDQHFIAAILTVIGYSMNDTVIVFDRIREFLAGNIKGNFNHIVNDSINSTLSRTINTSLTMLMVLLIMFIFGGDSIRGFIFAMLIGIAVGTYSSLFIATPVLVDTMPKSDKEEIEKRHAEVTVK